MQISFIYTGATIVHTKMVRLTKLVGNASHNYLHSPSKEFGDGNDQ